MASYFFRVEHDLLRSEAFQTLGGSAIKVYLVIGLYSDFGTDWAYPSIRTIARQALRRAARAYDRGRTDQVPVAELVEFARDCWPDYRSLPEYRGLVLRQRIGPTAMPYLQPLVLSAVAHKGREWLWWQSWRRRGI